MLETKRNISLNLRATLGAQEKFWRVPIMVASLKLSAGYLKIWGKGVLSTIRTLKRCMKPLNLDISKLREIILPLLRSGLYSNF